jgi:hypothetical protein
MDRAICTMGRRISEIALTEIIHRVFCSRAMVSTRHGKQETLGLACP